MIFIIYSVIYYDMNIIIIFVFMVKLSFCFLMLFLIDNYLLILMFIIVKYFW